MGSPNYDRQERAINKIANGTSTAESTSTDPLDSLSASSRQAFGVAESLRTQLELRALYTELLLVGLYQTDANSKGTDSEATWCLLQAFGITDSALLEGLAQRQAWKLPARVSYNPVKIDDVSLRDFPLSQNLKTVLSTAARVAAKRRSTIIRRRHLLAALLETGDSVAYKWLNEQGVPAGTVREFLDAIPEEAAFTPAMFDSLPSRIFSDSAAQKDALGFDASAWALAEMISRPETVPPVVIGVYGAWGSGKSTFLSLVKRHLEKRPRVVTVEYNAWAYADSAKLWAGLVEKISAKVEDAAPKWKRVIYWLNRLHGSDQPGLKWQSLVGSALLGSIPLAAIVLEQGLRWVQGHLPESALASLSIFLGPGYVSWKQTSLANTIRSLVEGIGNSDAEGVTHRIQEELQTAVRTYFGLSGEDATLRDPQTVATAGVRQEQLKVVVFIDELDRCPLEKIVEILEAIKLFLAEEIFIVVMAVDTRVVAEAIHLHYRQAENPNLPREYMEKIIQVPVRVPRARNKQLKQFVTGLTGVVDAPSHRRPETARQGNGEDHNGPAPITPNDNRQSSGDYAGVQPQPRVPWRQFASKIGRLDTKIERDTLIKFAGAYLDSNPRRIKRLLNTYRYVKILAIRSGVGNTGDAVWQRSVVEWLGCTMRWPLFMEAVIENAAAPSPEPLQQLWQEAPSDQRPPAKALAILNWNATELGELARLADNFLAENSRRLTAEALRTAEEIYQVEEIDR